MKPYPPKLKQNARHLRRKMTDAEALLWSRLRRKQLGSLQFYRQKPVDRYIVDFYCASAKLVIEVDGGQHFSEVGKAQDKDREQHLRSMGLRILRFDNGEVMRNIDGVLMVIEKAILESPHAPLLQRGDEGERGENFPLYKRGIEGD